MRCSGDADGDAPRCERDESHLRLGERGQTRGDSCQDQAPRRVWPGACLGSDEREQQLERQESEQAAVHARIRVGKNVAAPLIDDTSPDDDRRGRGRRSWLEKPAGDPVDERHDQRGTDDAAGVEDVERRAEQPEEERVQIGRERPVDVTNVGIKHLAVQ